MTFVRSLAAETPEQEAARLAGSPEGSLNHTLSSLPETIHAAFVRGAVLELPAAGHRIVVVPVKYRGPSVLDPDARLNERNAGSWESVVVASDHPSYPVGGYDIVVPTAQLVRGKRLRL